MVDIKINKTFTDSETREDIYILSIRINDRFHNIPVTKDEFVAICNRLKSINDNNEI
jgi:hypothetical protein